LPDETTCDKNIPVGAQCETHFEFKLEKREKYKAKVRALSGAERVTFEGEGE
jgi:hypothetical protein